MILIREDVRQKVKIFCKEKERIISEGILGYLDVDTPELLAQVIGYMKYTFREDSVVYFRGQTAPYEDKNSGKNTLIPSLFRDPKGNGINVNGKRKNNFSPVSEPFAKGENNAFVPNTPQYVYRPILQHYGMKTEWLDLVDNIWIALWFSAYKAIPYDRPAFPVSFKDKDSRRKRIRFVDFRPSKEEYSYIHLLQFSHLRKEWPGCFFEDFSEIKNNSGKAKFKASAMNVMDLRIAAPSLYLRPHVQHGIMIRRRDISAKNTDIVVKDYSDHIILTLRMKTEKVLEWLGNSPLLSYPFLFPSPLFDLGYRRLLWKVECDYPEYGHQIAYISY